MMSVLVTIGSTRFDALIQTVLSSPVLNRLRRRNYRNLVVQCGNSALDLAPNVEDRWAEQRGGVAVEIWRFKPTLLPEYHRADLVISHAGSGTILDVLRLGKPLIVVPNDTLLDDHQQELASSLAGMGYLVSSTVSGLAQVIEELDFSQLKPFPSLDPTRFSDLLDEEMGYK